MSVYKKSVRLLDGSTDNGDGQSVVVAAKYGVANAAGGGAGANVATAVTFGEDLPENYTVVVQPGQFAGWWISTKVHNGFTVNLTPGLSTATLAAGSFDVVVLAS